MQRRMMFVLAWVAVTGLSVLIATQAVGAVREQVTDSPATLATVAVSAGLVAPATTVPPATEPPLVTTSEPTTTTVESTTTSTTATDEPPQSTTVTAAPPPTTVAPTTTTAPPPSEMEAATYRLVGGWVRIRYGGGEVHLVDAAPNAGFSMDVEKDGPSKVEVEFNGEGYEGKFKADMEDGTLDVDIEDGDED